jgi:NIPSNAP
MADTRCCAVVELRQYTLKPGQREALIDLFERYLIEGQESVGMTVIGQFRDRHRPDRFVWLRGFPDMQRRHEALEAFYGGPIWAAHRERANDTMLDSDDVLLLKPARADTTFLISPRGASETFQKDSAGSVLAGIYQMPQPVEDAAVSLFEENVLPILRTNGVQLQGLFVTEPAPNTFKRLPVREGEHVLVWFGTTERRDGPQNWRERLAPITTLGRGRMSLLELEPTSRSSLGHAVQRRRRPVLRR